MLQLITGLLIALVIALLYFGSDARRWHRGRMQMFGDGTRRHY